MDKKEAILKKGKEVYLHKGRSTASVFLKHMMVDDPYNAIPASVLAEERFISGHNDTAGFVELLDANERIIRWWKFDFPMVKQFTEPDLYDDDCLILYLKESFGIPVLRGFGYTGYPSIVKVENLF